jgi:hypothetical protein
MQAKRNIGKVENPVNLCAFPYDVVDSKGKVEIVDIVVIVPEE